MTEQNRLVLLACRDDFLLDEAVDEAVSAAADALGGAPTVELGVDVTPARTAGEVQTPSLFDPERVLVIRDVRHWLDTTLPPGGDPDRPHADPAPLVEVLRSGLPPGVALVMGAWCGREPRGPLVDAVKAAGRYEYVTLPATPKPWEDVAVSREEAAVLRGILRRRAPEVRLERDAESLLFSRLGFSPRLLLAEVTKLATAAGDGPITEDLVRRLSFPRERSLEVVRDAVDARDPAPLADLLEAAGRGVPVRDWQGRTVDGTGVAMVVTGLVAARLADLLLIRRMMVRAGLEEDLDSRRNQHRDWYNRSFRKGSGPRLQKLLAASGAMGGRSRKIPSPWALAGMVRGASRYTERELVTALAGLGRLEVQLRSKAVTEGLAAWLAALLCAPGHAETRPPAGR